jgi:imidazolonepropionase-like amidohydrolase
MKHIISITFILLSIVFSCAAQQDTIVLTGVSLIDGAGNQPQDNVNIWLHDGLVTAITKGKTAASHTIRMVDMTGKTIMPALISAHAHIGTLKDTTTSAANYSRENIMHQLARYESYGVSAIMVMGTDRPLLFDGLRDSSRAGLLPGARIYSAGYGFGVPGGLPPTAMGMDNVFRPASAAEVPAMIAQLAALKVDLVKIWVDDGGGKAPKMQPEVYKAIISEAHKHNLRVAAHLYYLEDAHKLVDAGLDIIAHSIRDKEADDSLLVKMKRKGVIYIPTLSLDEFAFIYSRKPEWIHDSFFKASLEPNVFEMITSEAYQNKIKNDPSLQRNMHAFETALRNVKKIYNAGILVALGTDSGAMPIRVQGFSEHNELQLLTQAGLTPLQAIQVATSNAAAALRINDNYGTLQQGKKADFIVLDKNPAADILNTRTITEVWKAGVKVSDGPLQ